MRPSEKIRNSLTAKKKITRQTVHNMCLAQEWLRKQFI